MTGTGVRVIAATALLSSVLGSVHAFSVFLESLESRFSASRADVSLTYSLALISLTAAVLLGHRLFGRMAPARLILGVVGTAVLGAAIAGLAPTLWVVWLGYSLLFGAANGLCYGFGLQLAAQANPGREGLAMGIVTAAYALGAAVAPWVFEQALDAGGFVVAMGCLIVALCFAGIISAGLIARSGVTFAAGSSTDVSARGFPVVLAWGTYGAGVLAGLMAIGHAAGIAKEAGVVATWLAPTVLAICNFAGALLAGRMADRFRPFLVLSSLPLISMIALAAMTQSGATGVVIWLGLAGFAYGGIIAAWPAVIAKKVGPGASSRLYGRVFTAWGTAGLLGPWTAGYLYDLSGGYQTALWIAAGLGLLAAVLAIQMFARDLRQNPSS